MCIAQVAPIHGWPWHNYWVTALRDVGGAPVCTLMAADTTGVAEAASDFEICLGQLELIAHSQSPPANGKTPE